MTKTAPDSTQPAVRDELLVAADGSGQYTGIVPALRSAGIAASIRVRPGGSEIVECDSSECMLAYARTAIVRGIAFRCIAGQDHVPAVPHPPWLPGGRAGTYVRRGHVRRMRHFRGRKRGHGDLGWRRPAGTSLQNPRQRAGRRDGSQWRARSV